jgi:dipeptidyl aminopeptidase/acylaminoacyl peptidase
MVIRALAMLLAFTSASSSSAQTTEGRPKSQPATPPSIEQFMKIRAPNSPTLGPDGTLFVRDWPEGVNQLFMRAGDQPETAPMRQLTNLTDGVNSYSLSHDGKTIIFAAATGGSEQDDLYKLDVATETITPLMVNPKDVCTFQVWLRDDSGFIYTANDESPADFHVYRYDLAGGTSTKLLAKPGNWEAADVTDDGKRVLVQQYFSASHADAYELDTASGNLTKINIGADETFNNPAGYLPGETSAIVISDKEDGIARLFIRDLATGKVTKPLGDLDKYDIEGGSMNEDRSIAAITYNEGGYATLRLVSLPDFKEIPLPGIDKGVVGSTDVRGRMLTWSLSNTRTPGLSYKWLINSRMMPQPITTAETQGVDLAGFLLPELITYSSFDGVEVPAFLFTPPGFTKGQPIPFVVNFHGGPEAQSRPSFSALTQYLLSCGYGVMMPNVRGSTGYGREFHMMDNYKKRWDSVKDGVEAARWLAKNGYSENGRIAAYGGSYGGFMSVATIIEGPDVFGASVDVVGIVNFKTFLEQTKDYRRKLREAEYGPLTDPDFLKTISSIHRLDEIKAPMLVAHGLNDPRVPVGEAMQLAIGLQKRGYDPELLFFPDEGHGFAKLENRLLFAKRMVKFLDRTIKN